MQSNHIHEKNHQQILKKVLLIITIGIVSRSISHKFLQINFNIVFTNVLFTGTTWRWWRATWTWRVSLWLQMLDKQGPPRGVHPLMGMHALHHTNGLGSSRSAPRGMPNLRHHTKHLWFPWPKGWGTWSWRHHWARSGSNWAMLGHWPN